ncbi:MAG: putative molybdenum carrier protein [Bacteroidetes bacterium]|nr:putative molybdenum carrier protein [Bacteroidota bacterium]
MNRIKIISGGQSGVDRAALDFALKFGIECGGWCTKGRKAEDGTIDGKYPLQETDDTTYKTRTKLNVRDSDGTLILYDGELDDGTLLTMELAQKLEKPLLKIDLSGENDRNLQKVSNWINSNYLKIINMAGPRESNSPGIYVETLHFLEKLLAD